jgi:hypothetical protein
MASANCGFIPYFTVLDGNGSPVSGAKVYTYLAGSSTPQATYTDRTAATPNANPTICDSAGRATLFFDDSIVYKIVVKTSADVTLVTVDNFSVNPVISKATTLTISGNGTIGGTFGVTGNTTVGGTLGVTGAVTFSSTLAVTGNATVGGTLGVTGASTLTGALTLQSNAIAATTNRFLPHQAMVRVTKSATQSITSATDTAITWDQETFDTDTMHDTVTNNTRLTAPVTGKYLVIGCLEFAPNATGYRTVKIKKNGTTDYNSETVVNAGAGDAVRIVITDLVDLAAAGYVEIIGVQSSGAGLNVTTVSSASMMLVGV